jgi:hypothetical protein
LAIASRTHFSSLTFESTRWAFISCPISKFSHLVQATQPIQALLSSLTWVARGLRDPDFILCAVLFPFISVLSALATQSRCQPSKRGPDSNSFSSTLIDDVLETMHCQHEAPFRLTHQAKFPILCLRKRGPSHGGILRRQGTGRASHRGEGQFLSVLEVCLCRTRLSPCEQQDRVR